MSDWQQPQHVAPAHVTVAPVRPWYRRAVTLRVITVVGIVAANSAAGWYLFSGDEPVSDDLSSDGSAPGESLLDVDLPDVAPAPTPTGVAYADPSGDFSLTVAPEWRIEEDLLGASWITNPTNEWHWLSVYAFAVPTDDGLALDESMPISSEVANAGRIRHPDGRELIVFDDPPDVLINDDGSEIPIQSRTWIAVHTTEVETTIAFASFTAPADAFATAVVAVTPFAETLRTG